MVICSGQLLASKIHKNSNIRNEITEEVAILLNYLFSIFLHGKQLHRLQILYFSRSGTESLKWTVMCAYTLLKAVAPNASDNQSVKTQRELSIGSDTETLEARVWLHIVFAPHRGGFFGVHQTALLICRSHHTPYDKAWIPCGGGLAGVAGTAFVGILALSCRHK